MEATGGLEMEGEGVTPTCARSTIIHREHCSVTRWILQRTPLILFANSHLRVLKLMCVLARELLGLLIVELVSLWVTVMGTIEEQFFIASAGSIENCLLFLA
jgi:hypothetical protein